MAATLKGGAGLALGIDHPNYGYRVEAAPATRDSLTADLA